MNHNCAKPPVLDPSELDRLLRGLENNADIWTTYIRNFITQLPRRIEKLHLTLTLGDLEGAKDAILSLRTSSQMVGATQLTSHSRHIEQSLRETAQRKDTDVFLPHLGTTYLQLLKQCAHQTSQQLQHLNQTTNQQHQTPNRRP